MSPLQVTMQCAPLLKGLKVSTALRTDTEACRLIRGLLKGTNIRFRSLDFFDHKCLIFLYREEDLMGYLTQPQNREFLESYGYHVFEIDELLKRLTLRIRLFREKNMGFPHEIGLFLDYPLEDVKGYIKNNGKGSILTGYWQVYYNRAEKEKIFSKYKRAKSIAAAEFQAGKPISEIAVART